jgi:hypothetical protein
MSDTLKPFFVEYTVTAVVLAEDEGHAWTVARSEQRDVFGDAYNNEIFVRGEVTSEADMEDGWDLECVPYGGDGNTRIGDILKKSHAA